MAARNLSTASSRTFTASGAVSGSRICQVNAFGVACTTGSVVATLFDSSGSSSASSEIWTLTAASGVSNNIRLERKTGASGIYVSVTGTGSAMVEWA